MINEKKLTEIIDIDKQVKIIDTMYTEIIEAVHAKPSANDIEATRLYVDNVYMLLNKTVHGLKDLKSELQKAKTLFHETYNPPA